MSWWRRQFGPLRFVERTTASTQTDTYDYEEAAKAGNRCREKRVVVSIVDILLCAVAIKRQGAIFTTDPDFSNYAKVLTLRIHTPRI
jgi:predicted nucleic acid-binding protein